MRVLMLAPPGAGKGTIGTRIAERYQVAHLSSGELLRAQVEAGTELGKAVAGHLAAGDLVPDELVDQLMRGQLISAARAGGYVLDGFPRTLEQALLAYEIAAELGITLWAALYLEAPAEVLAARMLARGRGDDTPATIRHRLEVYQAQTEPLI
ncbi:MAG: adenylate kinase family protein, partial [Mycobacteriales bacterium]